MTIGEKMLNLRKARGWSQEELAERIGVTRQAVSRWESGAAKPDTDKVIAICDLFGVSADYLLRDQYSGGGEGQAPEPQPRRTTAIGDAVRNLTLRQWLSIGAVGAGLSLLLLLRLVYIFQDTNYYYIDALTLQEMSGYAAFLRTEELLIFDLLAWGGILGGSAPWLIRGLKWIKSLVGRFFHWDD